MAEASGWVRSTLDEIVPALLLSEQLGFTVFMGTIL